MEQFADIVKVIDLGISVVFIFIFARTIKYLFDRLERNHNKRLEDSQAASEKLEEIIKDQNAHSESLRKAVEMLTNAIINGLNVRSQGNQRSSDPND